MAQHLYGVHDWDPAWAKIVSSAGATGWCVTTHALSEEGPYDFRPMSNYGITPIARLNYGYHPKGTLPLPEFYEDFARLCGLFVQASPGCTRWIIGNESNMEIEWPQGVPISPADYARCFKLCRDVIRAVQPEAEVIVAPVAPWNVQSGPWLDYFENMLSAIGQGNLDGIALHAYTHGADPAYISSTEKRHGWHWHFRVYQDFLRRVPPAMRRLPVYVTEFNQGDEAWVDANSGFVQRAYAEVDAWNKMGATQKIRCLCLYRWPNYDRWGLENKAGVHADFRAAVARRYESPVVKVADKQPAHSVFVPIAPKEGAVQQVKRQWDERLTARGVQVIDAPPGPAWRVVKGEWLNEEEVKRVGPDHHILVDALDENGNRVVGMSFVVQWPSGEDRITTKANPGQPYAADYPMSKSLNEFSITAVDGLASDRVTGIGMGAYGNPAIHTSTRLVFQRLPGDVQAEPPAQPGATKPVPKPVNLAHPIADPALRIVSQRFGENPQAYAPLGVRGHTGIDYAVPMGTPVCAVDGGTVLEAQEDATGWGRYVKLGHTWGQSIYAHLDRMAVAVGHHVLRGQVIGQSGNTGRSTGPHLHFGIRLHPIRRGAADPTGMDGWTDPAPYLVEGRDPVEITPGGVWPIVREAAHEFGIDADLLVSLVMAESSGRPDAVSPRGAKGLGQIMPATWEEWRVKVQATDIFDPRDNARVSAAYLAWLLRVLGGDVRRALWAYNFGIGHILEGVQPPAETVQHAAKILFGRDLLQAVVG